MHWIDLEIVFARAVLSLPRPFLRAFFGAPRRSPDGLALDDQNQAILGLARLTGQPDIQELGVEAARSYMEHVASAFDAKPSAGVEVRLLDVPGAVGPRSARLYTPGDDRARAPRPALVFFHGGGFVVCSLETHDRACRALADKAGVAVLSVDYRLAPEHPFPAAVDDAVEATRWVLENARSLDLDPHAIAVGGDSAGGTLAAVVAQTLRGRALPLAFQLLVYPLTDLRGGTPSRAHFRDGYFLSQRTIDWYTSQYIPDKAAHRDPRASPLLASDLSGLPPALVITAGFDPLRDEGRAYADAMRAAGARVEYVCAEGSMHGFFNMSGSFRAAAMTMDLAAVRLRGALTRRAAGPADGETREY